MTADSSYSYDFSDSLSRSIADPALDSALNSLKSASNKFQAQVALNIIVVIVEHYFESLLSGISNSPIAVNQPVSMTGSSLQQSAKRHWYDVQQALKSASQLLQDCPAEVDHHVIPMVSQLIERTISGATAP